MSPWREAHRCGNEISLRAALRCGDRLVSCALGKLGIGSAAVSDGRQAEIYSPFRPFSRDERAKVEEQLQSTYELFLDRVAKGRSQETRKVDGVAQGRVWTGRQARELGLVDELGGLTDAIRIANRDQLFGVWHG